MQNACCIKYGFFASTARERFVYVLASETMTTARSAVATAITAADLDLDSVNATDTGAKASKGP